MLGRLLSQEQIARIESQNPPAARYCGLESDSLPSELCWASCQSCCRNSMLMKRLVFVDRSMAVDGAELKTLDLGGSVTSEGRWLWRVGDLGGPVTSEGRWPRRVGDLGGSVTLEGRWPQRVGDLGGPVNVDWYFLMEPSRKSHALQSPLRHAWWECKVVQIDPQSKLPVIN